MHGDEGPTGIPGPRGPNGQTVYTLQCLQLYMILLSCVCRLQMAYMVIWERKVLLVSQETMEKWYIHI